MSESKINYNIAFSTNFKLEIPDAPHVNYFLQQVTLPSIANTRTGFVLQASSNFHVFQRNRMESA